MTDEQESAGVVRAIRELYRSNQDAQVLFDRLADRERDIRDTSIVNICRTLKCTRESAIALARALEKAGCGNFIVGRRGGSSRFSWDWNCISLGQAAKGNIDALLDSDEGADEGEDQPMSPQSNPFSKMSLSQAKRLLADALGVPVSNIEIIVKA